MSDILNKKSFLEGMNAANYSTPDGAPQQHEMEPEPEAGEVTVGGRTYALRFTLMEVWVWAIVSTAEFQVTSTLGSY